MGRDEQLRAFGCAAALLGESGQEPRVQEVLRFFQPDEWRGLRVVHQHQVGKHLEGSVGREACEYWIVERQVLDLQEQAAIRHRLGEDTLDLWDAQTE